VGLQPVSRFPTPQSGGHGRLIVVSNRLPLTVRKTEDGWATEHSSGGLASAMNPLLRKSGGDWIGWAGAGNEENQESRRAVVDEWAEKDRCFAVELPQDVATRFYEGYANQTLWPVFHNFPSQLRFEPNTWEAYVEANHIFAAAVAARYKRNDLIWVHDYHLILLPQMLRNRLPDAAIGFFLHIPFPSSEIFPILPRREELLEGLLGADLLAFQTHGHLQQFRSALLRVLGMESKIEQVAVGSRPVRLEALPIGIAPEEYTNLLQSDKTTAQQARRTNGTRDISCREFWPHPRMLEHSSFRRARAFQQDTFPFASQLRDQPLSRCFVRAASRPFLIGLELAIVVQTTVHGHRDRACGSNARPSSRPEVAPVRNPSP
jgi:trehalose-6-phosphate synthase